jgi:2-polyprenyl-3-methyl-5-hydroxy-6-metoxy-1,4-benzoquinol methylase
MALAQAGELRGRVLDVGCGTGEHALMAAGLGLDATGIDIAAVAIAAAEGKARERGLRARFLTGDALKLAALGERFDTVLDCGLFHLFDDRQRQVFVETSARRSSRAAATSCSVSATACQASSAPAG